MPKYYHVALTFSMCNFVETTQIFRASNLSNFVPTKRNLWEALLFCFDLMKSVSEACRLHEQTLCQAIYGLDS